MFGNTFNQIDKALRNDDGMATELDYTQQTSWPLFLKYRDDLEAEHADDAALEVLQLAPAGVGRAQGCQAPAGLGGRDPERLRRHLGASLPRVRHALQGAVAASDRIS